MKIWIDGEILEPAQAKIPVLDHGLLYGDGVFEGMRVYNGRVFRFEEHLRRLSTCAKALHLPLPGGLPAMRDAVLRTAAAHGSPEAYVRLIVTRGDGALGVDPASCASPRVVCIVADVQLYPAEKLAQGIDLVTVSVRRPAADMVDPRVKSLNYLNNVLAKQEARSRGADEALVLNDRGLIAEASGANVFVVHGGRLYTPPASDGALGGITRGAVLSLAAELGVPAEERSLGRFDVLGADEAFLTGSGARIVAVRSLDREAIGAGTERPVLGRILTAFEALTRTDGTPVPLSLPRRGSGPRPSARGSASRPRRSEAPARPRRTG